MKLPTVSIVLVCRNECHNIEPYFKTLEGVADELIIVDTGSSDGTLEEIARCTKTASYPVHLYDYTRDFFHDNMARQFGGEKASCDYIFQVDTDERLSDGYRTKLKQFLAEHKPEIVTIPREDELVPHLHDVMDYRFYRKGAQAHNSDAAISSTILRDIISSLSIVGHKYFAETEFGLFHYHVFEVISALLASKSSPRIQPAPGISEKI